MSTTMHARVNQSENPAELAFGLMIVAYKSGSTDWHAVLHGAIYNCII